MVRPAVDWADLCWLAGLNPDLLLNWLQLAKPGEGDDTPDSVLVKALKYSTSLMYMDLHYITPSIP